MEALDVLQAKFAKVNYRFQGKFLWVRWEIPRLNSKFTQLNHFDILHSCYDIIMATILDHTSSLSHTSCLRWGAWQVLGTILWINLWGKKERVSCGNFETGKKFTRIELVWNILATLWDCSWKLLQGDLKINHHLVTLFFPIPEIYLV